MCRPLVEPRVNGPQNTEPVDEPSLRARLLSGAKWSVALRVVTQTYRWVITLVMVRLLTPEDYGLNAMLEAPIEILALVGTLGIDAALIRYGVRDRERLAAAFGWLLVVHGILFFALFVGAPWIAAYFNAPPLELLVQVAAVVFILAPFRVLPNALLDMNLDFKLKAQVELKATLIASLVGLGLAMAGAGVWALVAVSLLTACLTAGLLMWYRPWFVIPTLKRDNTAPLLSYGLTILSGALITLIAGKAIHVLAGPKLGPEILGVFAVASLLSYLPISKAMPILQQILYPTYVKLANDATLVKRYVLHAFELSFLAILPLAIGIAAVSEPLVETLFGPRWQSAALPLALLSLLAPLRLVSLLSHAPLNATGHARSVASLSILNLLILAGGALIVAPYGLNGLVVLAACASLAQAIRAQALLRQKLGLGVVTIVASVWRPALCASLLGGSAKITSWSLDHLPSAVNLVASTTMGSLSFAVAAWLLMASRLRQIWHAVRNEKDP